MPESIELEDAVVPQKHLRFASLDRPPAAKITNTFEQDEDDMTEDVKVRRLTRDEPMGEATEAEDQNGLC